MPASLPTAVSRDAQPAAVLACALTSVPDAQWLDWLAEQPAALVILDQQASAGLRACIERGIAVLPLASMAALGESVRQAASQLLADGHTEAVLVDTRLDVELVAAQCAQLAELPPTPSSVVVPCVADASRGSWRIWHDLWLRLITGRHPGDGAAVIRRYPLAVLAALPLRGHDARLYREAFVRAAWAGLDCLPLPVSGPPTRLDEPRALAWRRSELGWFARRLWPWPHRRLVQRPPFRWRELFAEGLSPLMAALAAALGGAMAVAPIPGLQLLAAIYLARALRLNMAIVVLSANVSFGPLLLVWAALSVALGSSLWHGQGDVLGAYATVHGEISASLADGSAFHWLMLHLIGYWALGSLLVMPAVALLLALITYGLAKICWWRWGNTTTGTAPVRRHDETS